MLDLWENPQIGVGVRILLSSVFPPSTAPLEIQASSYEFGGGGGTPNIQSIVECYHFLCHPVIFRFDKSRPWLLGWGQMTERAGLRL